MRKLYLYISLAISLLLGTYFIAYNYNIRTQSNLNCDATIAERTAYNGAGEKLNLHGWLQVNTMKNVIKIGMLYESGLPRWKGIVSYTPGYDIFGNLSTAKIITVTPDIQTVHSKSNDIDTSFFEGKTYPLRATHLMDNVYFFELGNNAMFCLNNK